MAFNNFFEGRAEYPTFKKKPHEQSATYASNAFKWDGEALTLAKMNAPLAIRWHRCLPKDSKPSSVTISKDGANRYFISILLEEEIKPLPVTPQMVGLDLGIKSMVALSTGESVGNPHRDTNAAMNVLAEGHAASCLWREYKTRSGCRSSGNSQ
jgi:putative transposase